MFVCNLDDICLDGFSCTDPDGNLVSSSVNIGTLNNGEVCFTPVIGSNQIILTCTDECGAQSSCTTNVTIALNSPPEVTCAAGTERTLCGPEEICVGPFSATDSDGNLVSTTVNFGTLNGDNVCFTPDTAGVYTIRAIATDACGISDTCETQIAVDYYAGPQFSGNSNTDGGMLCAGGQVCVALPTVTGGNPPLNYSISGNGSISGDSVCFNLGLGENNLSATVIVTDDCGNADTASVTYTATVNRPPVASCDQGETIELCDLNQLVCVGGFTCSDLDNNLDSMYVTGPADLEFADGIACFTPGATGDFEITLHCVDECGVENTCSRIITIVQTDPLICEPCPIVKIEKAHKVLQGNEICIEITSEGSARPFAGYDLLISYDNSALSALSPIFGTGMVDCGWEYFTYRFGANGNCEGGCPSGLLRLVALAETNNGANHPLCYGAVDTDPIQLAQLCFLVSNDRTLECQYAPVRFYWMDCGDNAFSNMSGDTLYISDLVYDYDKVDPVNDPNVGYPTYQGAQTECTIGGGPGKEEALPCITFINGGIDIVCADSIDARGDLNLNGLSNEIADAVMFTEYFVEGLSAFGTHIEGSIAASEVNGDGVPLTVADLVYLVRVIVGDATPLPKLTPYETKVDVLANNDGIYEVSAELGAVYFVFAGDVEVTLLQSQMALSVGKFDDKTHVLVSADLSGDMTATISAGALIAVNGGTGELISVDAADVSGSLALVTLGTVLPESFALYQNFPNPFNPQTKITFDLPKTESYALTIYNISGQKVAEFNGTDQGTVEVIWEAGNNASGLYFYKLSAGDFAQTRKMVLLK
jgi:hypothetical protein